MTDDEHRDLSAPLETRLTEAAWRLGGDLDATEALLHGHAVPRHRLSEDVLDEIGELRDGPPLRLDEELALAIIAARRLPEQSGDSAQSTAKVDAQKVEARQNGNGSVRSLGVVLAGAGSVGPARITGLHELRVLCGKVTVVAGEPKLGKSLYTLVVVLEVIRAGGRATIISVEDDLADTILPRLLALGLSADELERVSVVKLMKANGSRAWEEPLTFPDNLDELAVALEGQRQLLDDGAPLLLIVDPLGAHMSAGVNSWNETELRRALGPLQTLAADTQAAVLVVAHLNKATGASAHYRVAGSIGLVAAARSVLFFSRDPADPDGATRLLAHSGNHVPLPTLRYRVEGVPIHVDDGGDPIGAVRLVFVEEAPEFSFDDLGSRAGGTASGDEDRDDQPTALDEAAAFLTGELAFGPRQVNEVNRDADGLGIARATLKRARQELAVESYRTGGPAEKGYWMLRLPIAEDVKADG